VENNGEQDRDNIIGSPSVWDKVFFDLIETIDIKSDDKMKTVIIYSGYNGFEDTAKFTYHSN
jgi:predicted alpha/beta superfamily hydrolase